MTDLLIYRTNDPQGGLRWLARMDDKVYALPDFQLSRWLAGSVGRVAEAVRELKQAGLVATPVGVETLSADNGTVMLPPIEADQEVWAAGVTYERSREARQEESADGGDVYARVYSAERPELFFKSSGWRVVGQGAHVGIRGDSSWNVPEPELTFVINPAMQVVGFTIGNDMSSRSIEGENPLYLPQAKVYTGSCALGPAIWLVPSEKIPQTTIRLQIERGGAVVFDQSVHTSRIKRALRELTEYLGRANSFPYGAFLMTGTGIVPPPEFTLEAGDVVSITIEPIGTLRNTVMVV